MNDGRNHGAPTETQNAAQFPSNTLWPAAIASIVPLTSWTQMVAHLSGKPSFLDYPVHKARMIKFSDKSDEDEQCDPGRKDV
jgi:hypothetical protein